MCEEKDALKLSVAHSDQAALMWMSAKNRINAFVNEAQGFLYLYLHILPSRCDDSESAQSMTI